MKVYCQFGFSKNYKEGQKISIYHNGNELQMDNGDYITSLADRQKKCWYLKSIECNNGDMIEIDCKVGMKFLGPDEDRTFKAVFSVHEDNTTDEFEFKKVGDKDFPLLKGKISQISLVTKREERVNKLRTSMEEQL